MHRVVHLDLKGAPWNVKYLERVLLQMKSWGATGVLFEWEDTFPYTDELSYIGSLSNCGGDYLYTVDEVKHLLEFSKKNGLEPIQLVQTIGHLEFVLKHPVFRCFRESSKSPAVICPTNPQAQRLVRSMVEQVLEIQPDAKFIHIGADEVWHMGVCNDCQKRATMSEHKSLALYLDYIRDLLLYIKQLRPDITILMWDDMLRPIRIGTLRAYKLGDLVQPVMWNYNMVEYFQVEDGIWNNYRQLFPDVWAGSAFKGANGSNQVLSPACRYVSNQQAWMEQFKKFEGEINFTGIILTGWSRYDHYATLCELLPVALPSLASCLRVLVDKTVQGTAEELSNDVLRPKEWPGEEVARCINAFVLFRERCYGLTHGECVMTWMNAWQLDRNYTNPVHMEDIARDAQTLQAELTTIQTDVTNALKALTGPRTTEEWVKTNCYPLMKHLLEVHRLARCRVMCDASVIPT